MGLFPLPLWAPLWERVARTREARSRWVRGLSPRMQTPHPSRTSSAPPSPTRGEGKRSDPWAASSMPHARGGRMSRHLKTLAGIGDLAAVDFQDREILVHVIAGENVLAIRRERHR